MWRYLRLVLITVIAFMAIDVFFMDGTFTARVENMVFEQESAATGAGNNAVDYLESYYSGDNAYLFEFNKWKLRQIGMAGDDLVVTAEIPKDSARRPHPPTVSQVVHHCPLFGFDDYWDQDFAKPFTIYLSKEGSSKAITLVRCGRLLNQSRYHRMTGQKKQDNEPEMHPLPGEDAAALNAAAENGDPSFAVASSAVSGDKANDVIGALKQRPELVDLYDGSGKTLLFDARSPKIVRILVGHGADINHLADGESTPLQWAAETSASVETLQTMIWEGADVNLTYPEEAATAEIAELLLDEGAPVGDDALIEALRFHENDIAGVLYAHGARFDPGSSTSPLHHLAGLALESRQTVLENRVEAFRLACEYGADPQRLSGNQTVLAYVMSRPDSSVRAELLKILESDCL
jgi:hypothetical protein